MWEPWSTTCKDYFIMCNYMQMYELMYSEKITVGSQFVWPEVRWPTCHLAHIWETENQRRAHPLFLKWWWVLSRKETGVSWNLAHLQDFLQSNMKHIWPSKSKYMHFPLENWFLQDFFLEPRNFSVSQFSYLWDGNIHYIYPHQFQNVEKTHESYNTDTHITGRCQINFI